MAFMAVEKLLVLESIYLLMENNNKKKLNVLLLQALLWMAHFPW